MRYGLIALVVLGFMFGKAVWAMDSSPSKTIAQNQQQIEDFKNFLVNLGDQKYHFAVESGRQDIQEGYIFIHRPILNIDGIQNNLQQILQAVPPIFFQEKGFSKKDVVRGVMDGQNPDTKILSYERTQDGTRFLYEIAISDPPMGRRDLAGWTTYQWPKGDAAPIKTVFRMLGHDNGLRTKTQSKD